MSKNDSSAEFIQYLSSKYPPTLCVRHLSEITNETEQTIRNSISKGVYPIPSFKLGRKRLFKLTDVFSFINQQFLFASKSSTPFKPPVGRPTKAAQVAKRRLAQVDISRGSHG